MPSDSRPRAARPSPSDPGPATSGASAKPAPSPKQAVILVHGMGEQTPMESLRGFVETMWVRDTGIKARRAKEPEPEGNPVWWKPDPLTGSLELSRITTRGGHREQEGVRKKGPRTDFFEFYWADLTAGNTLAQLRDWFMSLLWRRPDQVPAEVRTIWIVLWTLTLVLGWFALWHAVAVVGIVDPLPLWAKIFSTVWALLYAAVIGVVLATFGDVAHYVRAKPSNIAARNAIRQRGLVLLSAINDCPDYDRVVLVGHSLGSIIAYDLLKLFWSERGGPRTMTKGDPLHTAFGECARAAAQLNEANDDDRPSKLALYRNAQASVFKAMQGRGEAAGKWIISDFVTVGSPLTHARFLLARDEEGLKQGVRERRFPASPPVFEERDGFLYQPDPRDEPSRWQAHHAANFAAVRWTNIHDPAVAAIFGDVISGPLAPNFGSGIEDRPVTILRSGWSVFARFFTHTRYWTDTGAHSPQLELLRRALELVPAPQRVDKAPDKDSP